MSDESIEKTCELTAKRWYIASVVWLTLWLLVFYDSVKSAVSVWFINDTYNHGFLILPGVIFFIWKQRGAIFEAKPSVSIFGILCVLALLFIYALGLAAFIEVFQHIAVFLIIPATFLALFGWAVVKKVLFPLIFVVFSIPVGEELIPFFQEITAFLVMLLLEMADFPSYRDGLYIAVPNGQFVVAEACSGVRFFVACLVFGAVYAYINIISIWRAAAFILISLILPILANGVRAWGIVYIGQKSSMQYAVTADHLVYGFIFFAFVLFLLFWVGHFISDGRRKWQDRIVTINEGWSDRWRWHGALLAACPLLLALVIAILISPDNSGKILVPDGELERVDGEATLEYDWTPRMYHADEYRMGLLGDIGLNTYQAAYYQNQKGRELVSWENRIYDPERWTLLSSYSEEVSDLGAIDILNLTRSGGSKRLVAYWYTLANGVTSSPGRVKVYQALSVLTFEPAGGMVSIVSMPYQGDMEIARHELNRVLNIFASRLGVKEIPVENRE